MKTKIKHLILDIGGVIVVDKESAPLFFHRNHPHAARIERILGRYELLCDQGRVPFSSYVQAFNKEVGTRYSASEYQQLKHRIVKFNWLLINFCRKNKNKFKTSILSDNNRNNVMYYNKHIKLNQWTFQRVFSYFYKVTKPHPKIYKILLNKLKTMPQDCLFVDDHIENVAGARKVGMHALLFKDNTSLFTAFTRAYTIYN